MDERTPLELAQEIMADMYPAHSAVPIVAAALIEMDRENERLNKLIDWYMAGYCPA